MSFNLPALVQFPDAGGPGRAEEGSLDRINQ